MAKVYLGDSVYAVEGSYLGEIVLTTENGYAPSNTIVIGPNELSTLLLWIERNRQAAESTPATKDS